MRIDAWFDGTVAEKADRTACSYYVFLLGDVGYITCVTNYVDQQTLKPDDDYVLPHQRLWTFDVLVCPLSVTERFL